MEQVNKIIDKLGLVLNLLGTSSNKSIIVGILKGIKKDIDSAIKHIEGGE